MAALLEKTPIHGFCARWKLDEAQTLSNITSEIQTIEGMPGVKWNLKWNYTATDSQYQIYLNIESETQISYEATLFYFKNPETTCVKHTGKLNGQQEILLKENTFRFQSYATNQKLIISVDGKFSYISKECNLDNFNAAAQWGLRLKENYPKDFDICVEGKIIQIHKIFVAAESTVFSKMFESNFKEAAENKVAITDAKFETVQAAMNYCYRQNISDFLQDLTNSINLLFFCDKYDLQTLKPMLEEHLSTTFLSKDNISLLVTTSDQTNALKLRRACVNFVCDLLKKNSGFTAEEIANFDVKFKDDVLFQALK